MDRSTGSSVDVLDQDWKNIILEEYEEKKSYCSHSNTTILLKLSLSQSRRKKITKLLNLSVS